MVARRVPLLTKIVLSVVEDALTFVTTVAACAVACGVRSIGSIALSPPHFLPVLSRKAREREYEELGERLLEETRKEEDDALDANLRRISMEFAIPRTRMESRKRGRFVSSTKWTRRTRVKREV